MEFDKESQVRVLRVAADRSAGKTVDEVDERIAMVMDLHPEFNEIWKQGELATYPQEIGGQIVSPFVHTVLHVIVDQQINAGQPDFVEENFNRLLGQGMDRHHCLHVIMGIYSELYFTTFRRGKQFDTLDYESRLCALSYEDAEKSAE